MKKRFTEEQIVAILRDAGSDQKAVGAVCRRRSISVPTFYAWRRKYGSMAENEVRRLRELKKENGRLKRLLAEREVEVDIMWELLHNKSSDLRLAPAGGDVHGEASAARRLIAHDAARQLD